MDLVVVKVAIIALLLVVVLLLLLLLVVVVEQFCNLLHNCTVLPILILIPTILQLSIDQSMYLLVLLAVRPLPMRRKKK